jgi:hypothetical protein
MAIEYIIPGSGIVNDTIIGSEILIPGFGVYQEQASADLESVAIIESITSKVSALNRSTQETTALIELISGIVSGGKMSPSNIIAIGEDITVVMSILGDLGFSTTDILAITENVYGQGSDLIGSVIC